MNATQELNATGRVIYRPYLTPIYLKRALQRITRPEFRPPDAKAYAFEPTGNRRGVISGQFVTTSDVPTDYEFIYVFKPRRGFDAGVYIKHTEEL